jgi:thioredoxin-like negative regulator of GroEL
MSIIKSPTTRQEFKQLINENSNKKIFVKYYADWCGPCKTINEPVMKMYEKYSGDKLMIIVDVDECDDVASAMKIRSLPTIQTFVDGMPDQVVMGSDIESIAKLF